MTERHVISATATTDGQQLAMCGKPLGPYVVAVNAGHIVGNYTPKPLIAERATCEACKARFTD